MIAQTLLRSTDLSMAYIPCCAIVLMLHNVWWYGIVLMCYTTCCMTVWRLIPQMMIKSTNVKIFKNV